MSFLKGNKTTKINKDEVIYCTKVVEFDAAHRVFDSKTSKCEKLHGHRYKAEMTFVAKKLNNGMVIDFSTIKDRVKIWIDKHWDHNVILSDRDDELADAIYKITKQEVFLIENNATTELMAMFLCTLSNNELFIDMKGDVLCIAVKLWETQTSFAEYKIVEY